MTDAAARVFVIDDDASLRKSLQRLLKAHGCPVETFESADTFLRSGRTGCAGCLVLDVHMPGLDGLALQDALVRASCDMPIIFLTGRGDIPTSVRAMKAGALDFLTKPVDDEVLLRAIQNAFAQNQKLRQRRAEIASIRERVSNLTEREREVMRHLITGALNKQIGGELEITEKTVKVHRGRVMGKMQAGSVAELVRLCAQAGIPPADTTKVP